VIDVLLTELQGRSLPPYQRRRRQCRLSNAEAPARVKSCSGMSVRCVCASDRPPHVRQPMNSMLKLCLNFSYVASHITLQHDSICYYILGIQMKFTETKCVGQITEFEHRLSGRTGGKFWTLIKLLIWCLNKRVRPLECIKASLQMLSKNLQCL